MDHQNWEPVVIRKSADAIRKDALRTGQKVTVERKSDESVRLAKLDQAEFGKPKMLSAESRQELVQRRLADKLTQQQLDQRCAFPPHTVRDLEANKRAPTQKELQTLNRVLKCGLKLS
jgi:hypothetical protein